MKKDYLCPECERTLNVNGSITFIAEKQNNERGIVFLSTKVGDYSVKKNDSFSIKEGERLEFYCPLCNADLKAAEIDGNLARVIRKDKSSNDRAEVIFSEISGQHSTYIIHDDDEVETFGEDNDRYMNFFGEGSSL